MGCLGVCCAQTPWRDRSISNPQLSSDGARPKGWSFRSLSKALSAGLGRDFCCCCPLAVHTSWPSQAPVWRHRGDSTRLGQHQRVSVGGCGSRRVPWAQGGRGRCLPYQSPCSELVTWESRVPGTDLGWFQLTSVWAELRGGGTGGPGGSWCFAGHGETFPFLSTSHSPRPCQRESRAPGKQG